MSDENLDRAIYGAEAIGREAHLFFDSEGNVDLRKAYYGHGQGYLDADKYGRTWVSTPRRVRRAYAGNAA